MIDPDLRDYLQAMEQRLSGRIETVETRLLTEFHKWASPLEARLRSHTAAVRALDLELEAVGDRVKMRRSESRRACENAKRLTL